jgi:sigma-E factor negative regulatory protein RseB
MRSGVDWQPRGTTGGLPPGTDPLCLWITTVAVVVGLVAGLVSARWDRAEPAGRGGAAGAAGGPPGSARRDGQHAAMPALRGAAGTGLRLLARSAVACDSVTYQGVEILDWRGPGGASASALDVWHQHGTGEASESDATGPAWPLGMRRPAPASPLGQSLPSAMDMSARQVSLLAANYRVTAAGQARVAGRAARIVTVRRPGGGLAARFWLDRATLLPLRREVYDGSGRLAGTDSFVSLRVGPRAAAGKPAGSARPWRDDLAPAQLAVLRGHGWLLPGPLPEHLALLDARETGGRAPVVHLAYSDGLSLVSVFIQRGHLPTELAGWRQVAVDGHRVYSDDPGDFSVAWSAHGFVYTLIAQAPASTVSQVVAALPHGDAGRAPGFIDRFRIGARRLLSWLTIPR